MSLADLMPVKDPPEGEDVIYLGGRADIRVRVELASGSLAVPAHVMRLQAMVEALPRTCAPIRSLVLQELTLDCHFSFEM